MKTHLVLLFCLFTSACFSTNEEAGAGAPSLDTTETALTTGAVIGAGVGAIVGSTAGEAGVGMVLGTIAGATSGGLIGKSIQIEEERIDKLDAHAGINTKKQKSSRSSLSETLWASAATYDKDDQNTPGYNNRPSGTKGIASKYVSPTADESFNRVPVNKFDSGRVVQLRQNSQVPQVPKTIESSNIVPTPSFVQKTTNTLSFNDRTQNELPLAATAPKIELQKPRPELPAFNAVPIRRPSLDNPDASSKYANLKAAAKTISPETTASSRSRLKEVAPKPIAVVEESKKTITKVATEAPKVVEAEVEKVETKVVETVVAKKVSAPQIETKKSTSVCSAGAKDFERASNASSDSDKVFYLRRVNLACPKETSSRIQLGKVYSKLGLKEEAKKEFNTVLELEPSNESAQDEMSIMMLDSRKN